ncbi:MAG: EAL domain-containing protein [Oceanicoccus sp.]
MNHSLHASYQYRPSSVMVFELPEPIDVSMAVEQQAEIIAGEAVVVSVNAVAAERLGIKNPCHNSGLTIESLTQGVYTDSVTDVVMHVRTKMEQFVRGGYVLENISNDVSHEGNSVLVSSSFHGLVENGYLKTIMAVFSNENFRKTQEQMVSRIARDLAADSGEAFFSHLVTCLAKTLGFDYAAVIELESHSDDVKKATYYNNFTGLCQIHGSELPLEGTPSGEVMKGEVRAFRRGVTDKYPRDKVLRSLNAEGYIAVPIWGEGPRPLGLLTLIDSEEVQNIELVRAVLTIFAIRASAELERIRLEEKGRQQQAQQKTLIENNTSGMFIVDVDPPMPINLPLPKQVQWLAENSRFAECNRAFVNLVGAASKADVLGRGLCDGRVLYDFATLAREFIGENYVFHDHIIPFVGPGRKEICLSSSISGEIVDNKLTQMLGGISDVSDRVAHSKEMEYRATHDGLTSLPNRSFFVEQVERVLEFSTEESRHAILILDLDGFKEVNDTLGHETGDELLKKIGPRLTKVLPEDSAMLARLGGDEFAILTENYGDENDLKILADGVMQEIRSSFEVNGLELVVGGSVGIAMYPEHGESVSSLMRCADIAMYQSKKNSTDFTIYNSDSDHYTMRRLTLMMDIRQAVEHGELRLFYQPIVNISDQSVVGFEGLIRWQHPELGMLSPGEFIPLIELTDTIIPVTWWVVETAVKQLAEWRENGWEYRISVNVSTRNLLDPGFVGFIESCLERYDVEGRLLEVEITESTLMADPEKARVVLQEISDLGVYLSVDDYGTGYSSLAYLKSLPINTLKIDRAFISQMLEDNQDEIIVNSTIQLAHNLGLDVTAEGIEDASLISRLAELGCDKGQGFFFCKPIPVEELHTWLFLHQRQIPIGRIA